MASSEKYMVESLWRGQILKYIDELTATALPLLLRAYSKSMTRVCRRRKEVQGHFVGVLKPFKHTILGGLLSFEVMGGWRRICVLRKSVRVEDLPVSSLAVEDLRRRLTGKSSRKSQISDTIQSNAKLTRFIPDELLKVLPFILSERLQKVTAQKTFQTTYS
ncbi:hypothetical protein YC2023_050688 [Brassica napus]